MLVNYQYLRICSLLLRKKKNIYIYTMKYSCGKRDPTIRQITELNSTQSFSS